MKLIFLGWLFLTPDLILSLTTFQAEVEEDLQQILCWFSTHDKRHSPCQLVLGKWSGRDKSKANLIYCKSFYIYQICHYVIYQIICYISILYLCYGFCFVIILDNICLLFREGSRSKFSDIKIVAFFWEINKRKIAIHSGKLFLIWSSSSQKHYLMFDKHKRETSPIKVAPRLSVLERVWRQSAVSISPSFFPS